MTRVVAIHQPNFLPWLGFFDKWARADVFILLDDVQVTKTGGSWFNRCGILLQGRRRWLTVPMDRRPSGVLQIQDVRTAPVSDWRDRVVQTLRHGYGRLPFAGSVLPAIEDATLQDHETLLDYNRELIERVGVGMLGLDESRLVWSSQLLATGTGTERLSSLVQAVSGDTYLTGDGSSGYLDSRVFERDGIGLVYQQFRHPEYAQRGMSDFVAGLSIVDALVNVGPSEVRLMFTH